MGFASQSKSLSRESLLVFFPTLFLTRFIFHSFKKVREAFLFKPCFEIC
jgi:hypothetical protein